MPPLILQRGSMTSSTRELARTDDRNQLMQEGMEVMGGVVAFAGRTVYQAFNTNMAALQVVGAAVDSNRQVSLAAIESSRQGQALVAAVANTAMQTTREQNQQWMTFLESQNKDARQALLLQMQMTYRILNAIIKNPTQAMPMTMQHKRHLRESMAAIRKIEREKAAHSRNARIDLVCSSIEHTIRALKNQKQREIALLFFASIAPIAAYYFGGLPMAASVTVISLLTLYGEFALLKDIDLKMQWMKIYVGALNRLKPTRKLTVLSAVTLALAGDPTVSAVSNNHLLKGIPNTPVSGDPNEEITLIPNELQTLVDHAQQPPHVFRGLRVV